MATLHLGCKSPSRLGEGETRVPRRIGKTRKQNGEDFGAFMAWAQQVTRGSAVTILRKETGIIEACPGAKARITLSLLLAAN